jgi:hypothetical protein
MCVGRLSVHLFTQQCVLLQVHLANRPRPLLPALLSLCSLPPAGGAAGAAAAGGAEADGDEAEQQEERTPVQTDSRFNVLFSKQGVLSVALKNDKGTYEWHSKGKGQVSVRIDNSDSRAYVAFNLEGVSETQGRACMAGCLCLWVRLVAALAGGGCDLWVRSALLQHAQLQWPSLQGCHALSDRLVWQQQQHMVYCNHSRRSHNAS